MILTRWAVLRVGSSLCTRQDRVVFSAGTGGTDGGQNGGKVTVAQGLRRAFLTQTSMKTPAVLYSFQVVD